MSGWWGIVGVLGSVLLAGCAPTGTALWLEPSDGSWSPLGEVEASTAPMPVDASVLAAELKVGLTVETVRVEQGRSRPLETWQVTAVDPAGATVRVTPAGDASPGTVRSIRLSWASFYEDWLGEGRGVTRVRETRETALGTRQGWTYTRVLGLTWFDVVNRAVIVESFFADENVGPPLEVRTREVSGSELLPGRLDLSRPRRTVADHVVRWERPGAP